MKLFITTLLTCIFVAIIMLCARNATEPNQQLITIECPADMSVKDFQILSNGNLMIMFSERSVHDVPHTYYIKSVDKNGNINDYGVLQEN